VERENERRILDSQGFTSRVSKGASRMKTFKEFKKDLLPHEVTIVGLTVQHLILVAQEFLDGIEVEEGCGFPYHSGAKRLYEKLYNYIFHATAQEKEGEDGG
jgi:hypothetical protein